MRELLEPCPADKIERAFHDYAVETDRPRLPMVREIQDRIRRYESEEQEAKLVVEREAQRKAQAELQKEEARELEAARARGDLVGLREVMAKFVEIVNSSRKGQR